MSSNLIAMRMKYLTLTLALLATQACVARAMPGYAVVDRIAIGGDARWDYLYVDSPRQRLYVSHGGQTEVIDTQSRKVVGTITATPGVHGIAIAADLGLGFTSNGKDDSVTAFDLTTLRTVATIKVGQNPDSIVYDPNSQRVVTFNGRSKDASVIDVRKRQVVGTVALGGKPEFAQVSGAGKVYFNVEDRGELAVLDPRSARLLGRYALPSCVSPSGLAMDDQERLYSVCANKQMSITGADGSPLARSAIGAGPDGVAWLDGYAFSANGADGTISVVGLNASGQFETVATIATARGARTIAADPARHILYLPTADMRPSLTPGARPQGLPDTFHILVVQQK